MVRHFDVKLDLFGKERLGRNIVQDDLDGGGRNKFRTFRNFGCYLDRVHARAGCILGRGDIIDGWATASRIVHGRHVLGNASFSIGSGGECFVLAQLHSKVGVDDGVRVGSERKRLARNSSTKNSMDCFISRPHPLRLALTSNVWIRVEGDEQAVSVSP